MSLRIRITKARTGKQGAPKAVLYVKGLFDPNSDLEALIEGYGLANVIARAKQIEQHRRSLPDDHFKSWEL